MNYPSLLLRSLLAGAACLCLSGCLNLKPAQSTARYFVLSPIPGAPAPAATPLAVGVGQVKLPSYLFKDSLAVRKGTNEVEYLEAAVWAEALNSGFQRVLAANLATLLATDQIRLSAWRREDVTLEVYVTVEQFDTDTSGRGVLVAWWRIMSPGGATLLKAGQFRASRQGAAPQAKPQGATATLSELLADLSRELAEAMKAVAGRGSAGQ
jgi:uncharacterized lipoprotein YmbA